MAEKLLCTEMNQVEQQRLVDLAFVHYNLQLLNFESRSADDFSIFEIGHVGDWIGDHTRAVSPSDTMTSGEIICEPSKYFIQIKHRESHSQYRLIYCHSFLCI